MYKITQSKGVILFDLIVVVFMIGVFLFLLAMLLPAFGSNAEELPNEDWVKKELEKTSCNHGLIPTYRFTQLNPVRSYLLIDGKLVLKTFTASCPEGKHYTGSLCIEILCTQPDTKQAE